MNSLDMETPAKCAAIDSKILGENGTLNQLQRKVTGRNFVTVTLALYISRRYNGEAINY